MNIESFKEASRHQISAVFFDLDGTVLDTDDAVVEDLAGHLQPIVGDQRAPQIARWLLMRAETPGNALVTLIDYLGLDESLLWLTDKLRRKRGAYPAAEFRFVPGVEEMLMELGERYPLGIVTTRSRIHVRLFLEKFPHLARHVRVGLGLQDTRRLKPHPEPVEKASAELGIPVERAILVGDTTCDVYSAKRAGAISIGVLCGFGEREELANAGADLILESTAQVNNVLH